MSMYKLTPTFPTGFQVEPRIACYHVSSYHPELTEAAVSAPETDPRKDLELKQQQLIERLKGQTEQLNKLLVGFGQAGGAAKTAKVAEKTPEPKDAKKDKDAKKEARKAAKAQAVAKLDGAKPAAKLSQATPWTVEDDRKTWETNLTLTVNIPSSLVVYEQEHLKNATLTVRPADLAWVKALAKVGEKRGVSFDGEVKNQTKEKKTQVKVVKGAAPTLQFDGTTVKSLQTIWKVLGAALGLFSRRSQQVLSASHQSIWLEKSEKILAGTGDVEFATREASQFLARFDSLSSQWECCLADIVVRSLLNTAQSQPNNVETWAKKIDSLVA